MLASFFVCASLLLCADQPPAGQGPAKAPQPTSALLWPGGAPGALGTEDKDKPKVLVYRAPGPEPRPAIIVCPGGGYGHLAMGHEGHQIAKWLNGIGVTAVVLDYRHRGKGYGHPAPLGDAQRSFRLARHQSQAWGIDPNKLGVLGFSAGGHLASSVSVHHDSGDPNAEDAIEQRSCRPDFSVLCYAVIAFGQPFSHRGSQRNLLGTEPTPELVAHMSSERQVDATTPPTFLWHTSQDPVVPAQNSVAYYLALLEHKVPCEMHLFEQGRHGVGLGKGLAADEWPALCRRWLIPRGILTQ